MATIVPPLPTPPPPSGAAPVPAVTVVDPPPEVVSLPVGSDVAAVVASRPQPGQVAVTTDLGELVLQTKLPLPPNAQLQLQVAKVAPQVELLIKAINGISTATGKPVPPPAGPVQAQPASEPQPPPAPGETSAPAPGTPPQPRVGGLAGKEPPGHGIGEAARAAGQIDTVKLGATLKATVIRVTPSAGTPGQAPTAASATPPGPSSPAASSRGAAPTPAASPPSGGPSTTPAPSGPAAPPSGTAPATAPAATPSSGFAPRAGSELTVRLLSVALPNQPAPSPAPPSSSAAVQIAGTVTGATPAGITLVQTPTTVLALATTAPLPQGAQVAIEVVAQSRPAAHALPPGGFEQIYVTRDWPSLDEALATLSHAAPATAQHLASAVIPRADNMLTANILFFLSALRGGDVRSWLGDAAVRVLERDRADLSGRLSDDFSELSRAFNHPGTGEWRTALVPFFNGDHLEQVRMHTRGQKDEQDETETTRFIIDVEMSRLGRVQLDGLVNAKGKRLDLILRTARPFPPEMRQDIYDIFTGATEATGIGGNLQFQADSRFVDIDAIGETPRPRILI